MATIRGTQRSETLTGTPEADLILALRGEDAVYAGAGGDRVLGDSGGDALFGEAGGDEIDGGSGTDMIFTGTAFEPGEVDVARGGRGDDRIESEGGEQYLEGSTGDDTIAITGRGHAEALGGRGDDLLSVDMVPGPGVPPPPPPFGAPLVDVDLLGGRGADRFEATAHADGYVSWVKIGDFAGTGGEVGDETLDFDLQAGETYVDPVALFGALDKDDDGDLDALDAAVVDTGPNGFAEVVVDQMGLHLRAGDDWLTLEGSEYVVAADFGLTAIA